jgi:hypothetical protein
MNGDSSLPFTKLMRADSMAPPVGSLRGDT